MPRNRRGFDEFEQFAQILQRAEVVFLGLVGQKIPKLDALNPGRLLPH